MTGVELIAKERERQGVEEGWTDSGDDKLEYGELARAAMCYCMEKEWDYPQDDVPQQFPFANEWWKPTPNNRIRQLVKAGALIAAEIDRISRKEAAF
jgi:hypothetical protein